MMWRRAVSVAALGSVLIAGACAPPENDPRSAPVTTTTIPAGYPASPVGDDQIRLNQIQLVGTHNSYHIAPSPQVLGLLEQAAQSFPQIAGPLGDPASLGYTHASIPQQLARGIRTFEFDVWADPTGGRFEHPWLATTFGYTDPLFPAGMDQPGFKVFHIVDLDWRTECSTLQLCLGAIRAWSDANPGHLPVIINLEMEQNALPSPIPGTQVLPYDSSTFDALDAELRAALGDRIMTPDDVRGSAPDLRTAITTTGWPTLAASRGKVLFFMDNAELRTTYLAGHPSLAGRVMFTSSGEGQPDGAILKENDPGDGTHIAQLVQQGYIVRTRADADLAPVLSGTDQSAAALASGAQVVHTDFPVGEPAANGYQVNLGLPVQGRCNPVNTTPATCTQAAVVELQH
jgi:hypothetical protein